MHPAKSTRKTPEHAITPKTETSGRGADKKSMTNLQKAKHRLAQTETGKHKRNFRP